MGIKGIYGEIGPGQRVALSKFSVEHFEKHKRPLRIAIDISIWQFQIQSGRGGSNPALRTLYFRLLRLLSLSIQPLFVFDGPNKPPFKRNKRTGAGGAMMPNMLAKQLLKYFGFPFHIAPGEAEAECALLQREGIVDAVLSEDVDTLMFGCGLTIRNWSSENSSGKSPTHVDVYDAEVTKNGKAGLDREGMVLIALMSGGDYITEGIPGCGIKVACEAARAGYGKSLCSLARSDTSGLAVWRERLTHEIQTNESKHFRVKHKSLKIPENFPNTEVLGYYTHPVVSNEAKLRSLKCDIEWDTEVDIEGLRQFVAEAFEWTYRGGAKQLVRGLAPAMLISKLRKRSTRDNRTAEDPIEMEEDELKLIGAICGNRCHFSNDGMREFRVIYTPIDVVGLNLDMEEEDSEHYCRSGLATNNEDGEAEGGSDEEPGSGARLASPSKRRTAPYDPAQPEKLWIPETMAKLGVPSMVEIYEESLRNPKKCIGQKSAAKKAVTKGGMPKGALDKYVTFGKPAMNVETGSPTKPTDSQSLASSRTEVSSAYLAPAVERHVSSQPLRPPTRPEQTNTSRARARARARAKSPKSSTANTKPRRLDVISKTSKPTMKAKSPWDVASSQSRSSQPTSVYVSKTGIDTSRKEFRQPMFFDFGHSDDAEDDEAISRMHRKQIHTAISSSLADTDSTYHLGSHTINTGPLPSQETNGRSPLKRKSPNQGGALRNFSAEEQLPGSHDSVSQDFETSNLSNVTQRSRRSSPVKKAISCVIDLSSSPVAPKPPLEIMAPPSSASSSIVTANKNSKRNKKYFMPRESLDGAWKMVEQSQMGPNSTAWSDVEVVDLTAD